MLTQEDREMLQEVVQLIDDTHWSQGLYRNFTAGKTTYCLVGLVIHVTGDQYDHTQVPRILAALRYHAFGFDEYRTLEAWNDDPTRTREQVRELVVRTMTQEPS